MNEIKKNDKIINRTIKSIDVTVTVYRKNGRPLIEKQRLDTDSEYVADTYIDYVLNAFKHYKDINGLSSSKHIYYS